MSDKAKDFFSAFKAGKMSRRELMSGAGKLGITAATANVMLNAAGSAAMAADFDWMKYKGKKLQLLLNKHPYADAMIADLDNFKKMTGMDVTYDIFPEDVYFDKVTAALSSKSDAVRRLHDRRLHDLDLWSGRLGRRPEALYRRRQQDQPQLQLGRRAARPARLDRLERRARRRARLGRRQAVVHSVGLRAQLDSPTTARCTTSSASSRRTTWPSSSTAGAKFQKDAGGPYGIGVRGSRSWATIHPGFLSAYTNFGQKDFTVDGGKLKAAMNTKESKDFHKTVGEDDPGFRAEELVDLHLVSGRHRSRRRRLGHDLRRRHPRLFHERRRQQGSRQPRLPRLRAEPGRQGPDPERLDLVAGHVELLASRRTRPGTSCSGRPRSSTACSAPARWISSTRSARRSPRMPEWHGQDRQELSGLHRSARRLGARREDLLHRRSRCSSTSRPNGRRRCSRWWRRNCRSTKGSTSSRPRSTSSSRTPGWASSSSASCPAPAPRAMTRWPSLRAKRSHPAAGPSAPFTDLARTCAPSTPTPRASPSRLECCASLAMTIQPPSTAHDRRNARQPPSAAARRAAALSAQPAGAARLRRHPDPVRDGGLLFAAALPAEPAGA